MKSKLSALAIFAAMAFGVAALHAKPISMPNVNTEVVVEAETPLSIDFDPCNFFPWMPQCMTCPTDPQPGPAPQGQITSDVAIRLPEPFFAL